MKEYAPCSGCGETVVPLGDVCIDCARPDKRERGEYVQRLREQLDRAEQTLMDRFVMAALPTAARMTQLNYSKPLDTRELVDLARELAEEMIKRRA